MINEQILEIKSCISTFRDMYLEVIECLNHINKSIYGLPAIVVFIAANIGQIIHILFRRLLFPRIYMDYNYNIFTYISMLSSIVSFVLLYGIGHSTEKEVFYKISYYYKLELY